VLENVRNLKKPEIGENVRVGPTNQTDLFRARFVPSIEIENGRRFAARLVKQLTGGDLIKARRMREDMWEFEPTHIVIVAANHKPEVRGTDKGIWRRIKVVPWRGRYRFRRASAIAICPSSSRRSWRESSRGPCAAP
jgi:hypothetical protein